MDASAAVAPQSETVIPVTVSYEDLVRGADLSAQIVEAYGPGSVGLLCVSGVPDLQETRDRLLPLSREFGNLPEEIQAKYERPEHCYHVGWSRGKESFKGQLDYAKGSYYGNPRFDEPGAGDADADKYPCVAAPCVWPDEDVPDLAPAFRQAGKLLFEVGRFVARQMDRCVRAKGMEGNMERSTFEDSKLTVGRLLHYYPVAGERNATWCGWHNDNSMLTGLMQGMFVDEEGREVPNPDPATCGLFCCTREGKVMQVKIPPKCCAFQLGEAAHILSGGSLVATPHMVRGLSTSGVSREQFALFMEPHWTCPLSVPCGGSRQATLDAQVPCSDVPALAARWKEDGTEFGQFLADSFAAFYAMEQGQKEVTSPRSSSTASTC